MGTHISSQWRLTKQHIQKLAELFYISRGLFFNTGNSAGLREIEFRLLLLN